MLLFAGSSVRRRPLVGIRKLRVFGGLRGQSDTSHAESLDLSVIKRTDNRPLPISAKVLAIAPKQAIDIATAAPWSGTESTHDAVLRALVEAHPQRPTYRFRPENPNKYRLSSTLELPKHNFKPQKRASERLYDAREKTLDYRLNKATASHQSDTTQPEPATRPVITPAFDGIRAMADRRIEEARAKGAFNNLPKGLHLDKDWQIKSPYLHTTEYFLNRMIQKQNIVPPWIEKQNILNSDIDHFRKGLRRDWGRHAARSILRLPLSRDEQLDRARAYQEAEKTDQQVKFRDKEWVSMNREYHEEVLRSLNSSIRSYNLQAPSTSRRGYLSLEAELERCFYEVNTDLLELVEARIASYRPSKPQAVPIYEGSRLIKESAHKQYGLRQMIRDMVNSFRRNHTEPERS
ncbi:hypothetical protein CANCADRAFT_1032 [Tortispora caseinolytica NRRL Y-17796]|uniref:DnaJ homologue subfamily C member 28 conserved domain-containing protein n=1 Tax=Tortispora caseinolytica NRRL Y-17796 TaxID=767744 RepID=A0A1E4TL21_9ASCO|nr:hypothetical protein CANCADRAFT_1032 [Tortispora caseinolytica NRRL Y-17796]